jgi:hypothetical protein
MSQGVREASLESWNPQISLSNVFFAFFKKIVLKKGLDHEIH